MPLIMEFVFSMRSVRCVLGFDNREMRNEKRKSLVRILGTNSTRNPHVYVEIIRNSCHEYEDPTVGRLAHLETGEGSDIGYLSPLR